MENQISSTITCPNCSREVPAMANFCANCGKRLKEKPASTSLLALLGLFLVSVLLPPFGLPLTIRYLKSTDTTARVMGLISLLLTVAVLAWAIWSVFLISKNINQMVNQQLNFP